MEIRTHIEPGDIGYITYLHGVLYAREYGLDHTFEGHVAERLGEFAKQYDPSKDYFAVAEIDQRIVGSIMIHGLPDNTAMLRFFLVHPDARGRGLGKELMGRALAFCREHAFERIFLWTISDLKTAIHLYKQAGFECTERNTHEIWGASRTEERYDLVW
ncbi:MAG TPA: GNAT family N-acetyltransferase [Pyrinomonadaceae bacterium]|jgi:N-acetylglutamate synthase-like GNAT family acetyltransferase